MSGDDQSLSPSQSFTIALAGCGKMGSAMAQGWLERLPVKALHILDPHASAESIPQDRRVTHYKTEKSFAEAVTSSDALVIAVKPQAAENVCRALAPLPVTLPVLSIVAGKSTAFFKNIFHQAQPIIRSMPNTPAAIGKGATAAFSMDTSNSPLNALTEKLLSPLGHLYWVRNEELLDAVTGLSGSGPAYVFYLIETLAKAGVKAGLEESVSMALARQTVIGAAALAEHAADISVIKLRENVTSPNGTTAAGLDILMNGDFEDIIVKTVLRAAARSRELSEQ